MSALFLILLTWMSAGAVEDVEAMLRDGRVAEAVPVIEEFARDHPGDIAAQEQWIDLMVSLGAPYVVEDHYRKRAQQHPDDPDAHYLVGRAAIDSAASATAYGQALSLDPDHPRATMGIAAVHKAHGNAAKAVLGYKRALELDPDLEEAWSALLALYATRGQIEEAKALAELAILQVPSLTEPYLVYALLVPEHAEATLKTALDKAPDPRVHAALAELYLDQSKTDAVLAHAEAALKERPAMAGPRLAAMFARSIAAGTLDIEGYKALVELKALEGEGPLSDTSRHDALIARYPDTPLTWMSRARARASTDLGGARADLEKAVTLKPEEREAQAALGMLLVTVVPDRAARLLQPIAEERPYDGSLQAAFAKASIAAGRPQDALERLRDVARIHPYDVDVVLLHAHALSATGAKEQAYTVIADAADRIPDVRIPMARAAAAVETGRLSEAIRIYERLAEMTGRRMFTENAEHIKNMKGGGSSGPP